MKETLKRELNKTYLILSSQEKQYEESYEVEMIVKNNPQTILPLHVLRMDSELQLFYDISSKQSMKDCAGRAKIPVGTVRQLFEAICQLKKEVKDYLLDMESVLLDLEHIYTKEGKFYFCYCPWEKGDVLEAFRNMLEQILGNLDYHDTEGVELTYHLYQCACSGNFQISEILNQHSAKQDNHLEIEDARMLPPQEEEIPEELLKDSSSEKESEEEKKPGILNKILKFFMKKPEEEPLPEKSSEHPEVNKYFYEEAETGGYTEVLSARSSENTVLLEHMPKGKWKLRPLVPGYGEFCIEGDSFLVGKKRNAVDGFIGRDTISRIHSRLFVRQERLFISDANSTNGTYVNGTAIEPGEDVEIFAGDRILFADVGYECYNSL